MSPFLQKRQQAAALAAVPAPAAPIRELRRLRFLRKFVTLRVISDGRAGGGGSECAREEHSIPSFLPLAFNPKWDRFFTRASCSVRTPNSRLVKLRIWSP